MRTIVLPGVELATAMVPDRTGAERERQRARFELLECPPVVGDPISTPEPYHVRLLPR